MRVGKVRCFHLQTLTMYNGLRKSISLSHVVCQALQVTLHLLYQWIFTTLCNIHLPFKPRTSLFKKSFQSQTAMKSCFIFYEPRKWPGLIWFLFLHSMLVFPFRCIRYPWNLFCHHLLGPSLILTRLSQ